jgi:hypothetical protein
MGRDGSGVDTMGTKPGTVKWRMFGGILYRIPDPLIDERIEFLTGEPFNLLLIKGSRSHE